MVLAPLCAAFDGLRQTEYGHNTRRARGDAALDEQRAAFGWFFDHNPLPMWVYDLVTLRFLEVNAVAVTHYGYSRKEFLTMCITDVQLPEDNPCSLVAPANNHPGLQLTGERRHRCKNGQIVDVTIFLHALELGDRPAVVMMVQDDTTRKQTEQALQQSERRFRALIENGSDGIVLFDPDRTVIYASPSIRRLLGHSPEEVVGQKSCHHEQWDGTGYPRGLRATDIPLAARVFAVVDVWDALTSQRPYRTAWSAERARSHVRAHAGTHFDPAVVDAFLRMLEKDQAPDVQQPTSQQGS